MKLQRNARLALYAVLEFAQQPDRQLATASIAQTYDVSAHHLAKVLARLAQHGIVESVRGASGGYRFSGNAKRLTLLDVVALFQDDVAPGPQHEPGDATAAGHALAAVLSEIEHIERATLSSITVATMLKLIERAQRRPRPPPRTARR
ncbi:MAG TPA: Rrf2 family transcriptional regulator [Burkholderiaceae bacterium]|nr:Rrf2 family transcriptional regulator [Burkholderiaceae bacterium]